jgi:Ca2+-binding RTX toxin-like protein
MEWFSLCRHRPIALLAAVTLVLMAVPASGMGVTKAKAPVGVWSGGGAQDGDADYVVLAIANGPAGQQRAFFAFDGSNPEGVCDGGPAAIVGTGDFEDFGNGDGQLALTGDFICLDTNQVAPFSPLTVFLQYEHGDRWRGVDDDPWWVRRCVGKKDPTAIVGNKKDNTLRGTPGNDILDGLGGDDLLVGKGGLDILCGGNGNDILKGKAGIDVMLGGGGQDLLVGGTGIDFGLGGAGKDKLLGGGGTDFLLGEGKNDVIKGQKGPNDLADGGVGNDRCVAENEVTCER